MFVEAGVQALFVTVDAPQLGRREKDMRRVNSVTWVLKQLKPTNFAIG